LHDVFAICLSRVSYAHRDRSRQGPHYIPTSGPMCKRNEDCYTVSERFVHSFAGEASGSCSTAGLDLVAGGEDPADGGDVVDSAPSKAASALKALVLDSSFFSFSLTGGVPVRLLLPLSSRFASKLPPGPKFLRPLPCRPLSRLGGPKAPGAA